MPRIDEVTWTMTVSEPPATGAATHLQHADMIGDWEGYQCRITPLHWKRGLYQAQVVGTAWKEHPSLLNSYMTAPTALHWCLETMEWLHQEEDRRIEIARRNRGIYGEIMGDAMKHIGRLVGLEDSPGQPESGAEECPTT